MSEGSEPAELGNRTTDCRKTNETNVKVINENMATASASTTEKPSSSNSLCRRDVNTSSMEHDADDSSIADSEDSDSDNADPYDNFQSSPRRNQKDVNGIVLVNSESTGNSQCILNSASGASSPADKPDIDSIAVQNSSDITFGNKTFYEGPVTIKQFMYENQKWRPTDHENDNPNFVDSTADLDTKDHDIPPSKDETVLKKWYEYLQNRPIASTLILSAIVILIACIVLTVAYSKSSNDEVAGATTIECKDGNISVPFVHINPSRDNGADNSTDLPIISRAGWLARPPKQAPEALQLPSIRVIIAHTATENCSTQSTCTYRTRIVQNYHMCSYGWDDIGYNFLIGGDGNIYVGRGWTGLGAHTLGYNTGSICISFIGTYNKMLPPKRSLDAAQQLIAEGLKLNMLDANYRLYGHRQLTAFESPGLALYEVIIKWPHWSDEIPRKPEKNVTKKN